MTGLAEEEDARREHQKERFEEFMISLSAIGYQRMKEHIEIESGKN
jgi:hypothetical protein